MDKEEKIISRVGSQLMDNSLLGLFLLLGGLLPCLPWFPYLAGIFLASGIPVIFLIGKSSYWVEEVAISNNYLLFRTRFLGLPLRRIILKYDEIIQSNDGFFVRLNDRIVGEVILVKEISETSLLIQSKTSGGAFKISKNAVPIYDELCGALFR